eukprot:6187159-Pleurochrysis_carterae.AAC.1
MVPVAHLCELLQASALSTLNPTSRIYRRLSMGFLHKKKNCEANDLKAGHLHPNNPMKASRTSHGLRFAVAVLVGENGHGRSCRFPSAGPARHSSNLALTCFSQAELNVNRYDESAQSGATHTSANAISTYRGRCRLLTSGEVIDKRSSHIYCRQTSSCRIGRWLAV